MQLYILDQDGNTKGTLTSESLTVLATPFFDDTYVQDLENGAETFTFSTFAKSPQARNMIIGNYIAFQYKKQYKLFQIVEVNDEHTEDFITTAYCEMAGIELINEVLRPRTFASVNVRQFVQNALADTDWLVGSIDSRLVEVFTVELSEYGTVYSTLQKHITETFGGEIAFRVEINKGKIVGKYVDIYAERGTFSGYRFSYDKNMDSVKRTIDSSELVTALIGVGKDGLTFKSVEESDKPLNQDWIGDEEAYKLWNKNGNHIFGVYEFDTDSPHDLLKQTRIELQKRKSPKATYEVGAQLLGEDVVDIGDTVYVVDNEFSPPLHLSARVNQLKISFTDPNSNECLLANFKEVQSKITAELRQIASLIDSKFPIGTEGIKDGAVTGEKIPSGAIGGEHVQHDTLMADHIQANQIQTKHLQADSITADKIKAKEINAEHIQADSIDATHIKAESIETQHLQADSITAEKIGAEEITTNHLQANSITADKIDAYSITAEKIDSEVIVSRHLTSNLIDANHINSDSIQARHILADSITSDKIQTRSITSDRLVARSITSAEIEAGTITSTEIKAGSINADSIGADQITATHIASDSIGTTHLQSGSVTTDKLVIDNAFIKDAMIQNVSASKLTAGEINTGQVTIKSPNGNIVIAESTQQFRDENGNVRVQIGQDANGEFNFIILDETGEGVLIDHTGIKDRAIAEGLIKNSMIGDGEIDGTKVDINSIISKINSDGTTSLKGSKIYLDSTNQELELAFNEMKTSVTDTGEKLESLNTSFEIEQGKIKTAISNTQIIKDGKTVLLKDEFSNLEQTVNGFSSKVADVETKIDDKLDTTTYNSKMSSLEQSIEGISSKVTSVETSVGNVQDNLDNLSIGGRNYAVGTGNSKTFTGKGGTNETDTLYYVDFSKLAGKTITISFDYVTTTSGNNARFRVQQATSPYISISEQNIYAKTELTHYTHTMNLSSTANDPKYLNIRMDDFTGNITISNLKLEIGSKATDWTPAPEDVDKSISSVENYASTIDQRVDGISTSVSSLNKTVSGQESKISTAETSINQLTTSVGLKANATDVYTKSQVNTELGKKVDTSTYNNKMSSLDVSINGIVGRVSNTETSIETVSNNLTNLEVGGRNLLRNTSNFTNTSYWARGGDGSAVIVTHPFYYDNKNKMIRINANSSSEVTLSSDRFLVEPSKEYTFSMKVFNTSNIKSFDVYFLGRKKDSTNNYDWAIGDTGRKATASGIDSYVWTFKTPSECYEGFIRIDNNGRNDISKASELYITEIKLEKGNKATDWTPAPEDVNSAISEVTTRVSEAETKLEQTETAINLKANQKSLETTNDKLGALTTRVVNAESELNVQAGQIESRVTKTEFENLEIGGRNYAVGTGNSKTFTGKGGTNETGTLYYVDFSKLAGKTITISFDYIANSSGNGARFRIQQSDSPYLSITEWNIYTKTELTHYSNTIDLSSGANEPKRLSIRMDDFTGSITISNLKLEIGSKATDWTPAPEDIDSAIESTNSKITSAESRITQTEKEISSKVSTTDYNGTKLVSMINQTADSVKIQAKNVELTGAVTFNSLDTTTKGVLSNFDAMIINANPMFLDWSSSLPSGYSAFMNGGGSSYSKTSSGNGMGNALKIVSTGNNAYLQANTVTNQPFYKYVTVEATFMLESGSLTGSGILFRYSGSTNGDHHIKFADLISSPETKKWYTITKVIKRDSAPSGFTGYQVYPMGAWTGFGTVTAKTIQYDSIKARPSTEQEITAYENDSTISSNKGTWDRASNINSNGTLNTNKLSGTVSDSQVASASKWNTASSNASSVKSTVDSNKSSWDTAYSRVNSWTKSGKTTIDGGMIETNTITAQQIAVGDFTNYASWINKGDSNTSPWSSKAIPDKNKYRTTVASLRIPPNNVGIGLNTPLSVTAGEVIYYSFWIITDSNWNGTSSNSKLRFGDQDGTLVKAIGYNGAKTSWTRYSGTYTVANGVSQLQFSIGNDGSTGNVWIDDIIISKMTKGELIVDGSITSDHLSVNTLSAITANLGNVTAGNISGVNISGSTFTGDNMYIDGKIQVRQGRFEIKSKSPNDIGLYSYLDFDPSFAYIFHLYDGDITSGRRLFMNPNEIRFWPSGGTSGDKLISINSNGINVFGKDVYVNGTASGTLLAENKPLSAGGIRTNGEDFYIGVDGTNGGELRVTNLAGYNAGKGISYKPIRADNYYGGGTSNTLYQSPQSAILESSNNEVYTRSKVELRVTKPNTYNEYVPVRASSFPTGSMAEYKQDIRPHTDSALALINSSTIYDYRLRTEVKDGKDKLRTGLVIGKGYNTPECVIDGDGVEQYMMNSLSWVAIQELSKKNDILMEKCLKLDAENTGLKERLKTLEEYVFNE